jgi:hemerythrin-like domain-containing protein
MNALEQLRQEHKAITTMLDILEAIASRLEKGEGVDANDLERVLEFISVFSDRCHHGKEEDLLFPAMERAGIPREGGPIGCMLSEHDRGREHVRQMREATAAYTRGDVHAGPVIARSARDYVGVLREHIDKEDTILYPMAEQHVPRRELEALEDAFEKVETQRVGKGKHEAFHRLLESLAEKYLAPRARPAAGHVCVGSPRGVS